MRRRRTSTASVSRSYAVPIQTNRTAALRGSRPLRRVAELLRHRPIALEEPGGKHAPRAEHLLARGGRETGIEHHEIGEQRGQGKRAPDSGCSQRLDYDDVARGLPRIRMDE